MVPGWCLRRAFSASSVPKVSQRSSEKGLANACPDPIDSFSPYERMRLVCELLLFEDNEYPHAGMARMISAEILART